MTRYRKGKFTEAMVMHIKQWKVEKKVGNQTGKMVIYRERGKTKIFITFDFRLFTEAMVMHIKQWKLD